MAMKKSLPTGPLPAVLLIFIILVIDYTYIAFLDPRWVTTNISIDVIGINKEQAGWQFMFGFLFGFIATLMIALSLFLLAIVFSLFLKNAKHPSANKTDRIFAILLYLTILVYFLIGASTILGYYVIGGVVIAFALIYFKLLK
ncbi:hypothetical protein LCGC14_0176060 [marine sediment metagenome]|uniref:Uncharacterized protein n=1 Tax=marine sediment metagenome TaxID=412755 RepID=A0A0F9V7P0_9ZZZZ